MTTEKTTLNLADIRPQDSKFKLSHNGKTYRLRKISLEDELWINATFGDKLTQILQNVEMGPVCKMVFHQLYEADQNDFEQRDVTFMNDETGERFTGKLGGYRLLMALITGGPEEKYQIYNALLETIGISRPIRDILDGDEGAEKKSPPVKLTGPKSSTSSVRSTAGRRTKSSPSRRAK